MTRWMIEKSGTGIEKSGKSQNNQKKGEGSPEPQSIKKDS
jgi:hypothetical protein